MARIAWAVWKTDDAYHPRATTVDQEGSQRRQQAADLDGVSSLLQDCSENCAARAIDSGRRGEADNRIGQVASSWVYWVVPIEAAYSDWLPTRGFPHGPEP